MHIGNVGPGTMQPMGHVDIYANGGKLQPGCNNQSSKVDFFDLSSSQEDVTCSHDRALELFRDSLVSSCEAVAYECTDYDSFLHVKPLK